MSWQSIFFVLACITDTCTYPSYFLLILVRSLQSVTYVNLFSLLSHNILPRLQYYLNYSLFPLPPDKLETCFLKPTLTVSWV